MRKLHWVGLSEETARCDSQQKSHSGGTAEEVEGHSQGLEGHCQRQDQYER